MCVHSCRLVSMVSMDFIVKVNIKAKGSAFKRTLDNICKRNNILCFKHRSTSVQCSIFGLYFSWRVLYKLSTLFGCFTKKDEKRTHKLIVCEDAKRMEKKLTQVSQTNRKK